MKRASSQSINPPAKKVKCDYDFEYVEEDNFIEGELWRDVHEEYAPKGFGAQVSNKGRYKDCRGVIKEGYKNKAGYVVIQIAGKQQKLHRVIMKSFGIEPPSPKHKYVNHIDRDPSNNNLENLEWCTHKQNMDHAYATNENRRSSAEATSKPVKGRKIGESEWTKYESANDAARQLYLNHGSISQACRNGGGMVSVYYFEFSEPNERPLLEGEEWRKCKNGGGAEISNKGRFKDSRGVIKTPRPETSRYCRVWINGKNKCLHVLIAEVFLPPPRPDQTEVHHIDHNPSNNRLENLKWVTPSENVRLSHQHDQRKSSAEKRSKKVRARKVGDTEWTIYNSGMEASRALGIHSCRISDMCHEAQKAAQDLTPDNCII